MSGGDLKSTGTNQINCGSVKNDNKSCLGILLKKRVPNNQKKLRGYLKFSMEAAKKVRDLSITPIDDIDKKILTPYS